MKWPFTEESWAEYAQKNKIMFTSCKDCVFFQSPESCSCKRLDKFEENNVDIVSIKEDESEYKIVNGRICNMFRTDNWLKALKISEKSPDELAVTARKEIEVRCTFIVVCSNDKSCESLEDESELRRKTKEKISQIAKTMKSVDSSQIKPQEIILLNESWIQPYDFINYLRRECERVGVQSKWRLEHFNKDVFDTKNEAEESEKTFMKNVFKSIKSGYSAIFYDGEEVDPDYLSKIDKFLNDELKPFLMIKPETGLSGLLLNSILFRQFFGSGGSSFDNFFKQLEEAVEKQKCTHLIQPLSKILSL